MEDTNRRLPAFEGLKKRTQLLRNGRKGVNKRVEIGEKIRELRRQYGRTQEDLATALGVTCQAVSCREANGGYPISIIFHV